MPNPFDQNDDASASRIDVEGKTAEQLMEELVGEGKKYASAEEAVKALAYAQNHIGTLEQDNQTLRSAADKAKTVEDIMSQLQSAKGSNGDDTGGGNDVGDDTLQKAQTSPEDIEATVKKLLGEHAQTQSQQQNHDTVTKTLLSTYGASKAKDVWDQAEKNLGVDLEQMARTSPQAVLQLLGVTGQEPQQSSAPSSLRGDGKLGDDHHRGAAPAEGTEAYVNHMVKSGQWTRHQAYKAKMRYIQQDAELYKSQS